VYAVLSSHSTKRLRIPASFPDSFSAQKPIIPIVALHPPTINIVTNDISPLFLRPSAPRLPVLCEERAERFDMKEFFS
jgi:hypothetical protein